MTIRLPRIFQPSLINACSAPAPITLGKVQPLNGRNSSRAPVARIRRSYSKVVGPSGVSSKSERSCHGPNTRTPVLAVTFPGSAVSSGFRRQIWPPGRRLSSRTNTCAFLAAARAAKIPAGPAPIIATSARISPDLHSLATTGLTGANDFSINGYAAFKTNAHTANATPVSATHTKPLSLLSIVQKDHQQTGALFDFLRISVDQN